MFRIDKKEANGIGGGLLLYVKEKWQATCCTELSEHGFVQSLWCSIKVKSGKLLVGLCYRSPSSGSENDKLLELLTEVLRKGGYSNILIMGDFNYPAIDYLHNSVSATPNSVAAKFLETTQDLLLFQHVTEPTRVREGQEPSTLDYVFTDSDNLVEEIQYRDPLGKSDHVTLIWDLLIETAKPASNQLKFNYCKGDYKSITDQLCEVNWKETFRNRSVDQMWTIFRRVIKTLTEEHIPLKEEFRKRKGQWISKATIKLMKQRGAAWRKYRQVSV